MNSSAVTLFPTPLFNTPDLASCFGGKDGDTLPLDEQNLMRTVETVLFPGTQVILLQQCNFPFVWQIRTDAYPYAQDLFLDLRFVSSSLQPLMRPFPSASAILKTLHELENTRYIWGGNWPEGIPLLSDLYPSKTDLSRSDPLLHDTWLLKGVDCSGLLYYATQGHTPRNTSSLVHFGKPLDIEGKNPSSLLKQLEALDIIVWDGHVICVLDEKTVIESKPIEKVIKTDCKARLEEIFNVRKPVNTWESSNKSTFVARRWVSH